MKTICKLFIIFIISSPSISSQAEDIFKYEKDGKEYVCLLPSAIQNLLKCDQKLFQFEQKIKTLEELLSTKDQEISKLESIADLLIQEKLILTNTNVDLQKTIENQNAWWNSKWLWVAIGIVVGTGATLGIVYAINGN